MGRRTSFSAASPRGLGGSTYDDDSSSDGDVNEVPLPHSRVLFRHWTDGCSVPQSHLASRLGLEVFFKGKKMLCLAAQVEMLLEAYFMQVDNTCNKLQTLHEYIDDTEVGAVAVALLQGPSAAEFT